MIPQAEKTSNNHRVLIVGGGFAGLYAARKLGRSGYSVTLLDKRNFQLFQPLLYQVAAGALTPGDISIPLRVVLRRYPNVQVLMGTAYDFDPDTRRLSHEFGEIQYDTLIVATGVKHNYFGHDEWKDAAPGLKTVEHALTMRRRIFSAFERAELETDPERRKALMSFIVVGAGPTGVELAGAVGELAHRTMTRDFRNIDPRVARILLVEGAPEVLPCYPPKLRAAAQAMLEELGVTVLTDAFVEGIEPGKVIMRSGGNLTTTYAETILWAAGVRASAFGEVLAAKTDASLDEDGKVLVEPDLSLPGHPEIFVIGDLAHCEQADGEAVPGVAPAAIQQGRYVARLLKRRAKDKPTKAFKYFNKGAMAVIGRNRAVADLHWLQFGGLFAWMLWAFVHIWSLIGNEQRIRVFAQWAWKYFNRRTGDRLITGEPPNTRRLLQERSKD